MTSRSQPVAEWVDMEVPGEVQEGDPVDVALAEGVRRGRVRRRTWTVDKDGRGFWMARVVLLIPTRGGRA